MKKNNPQKKKDHIEYLRRHIVILTNRIERLEDLHESFADRAFNHLVLPDIRAYKLRIISIQSRILTLNN